MHITVPTIEQIQQQHVVPALYSDIILEQDYFIALIAKFISESHLAEKMILKGGNAVNHIYLDQYRFSNDLDFEGLGVISFQDLEHLFDGKSEFCSVEREYFSAPSMHQHVGVQYMASLGILQEMKLDINGYSSLLLPPEWHHFKNHYGFEFSMLAMDVQELAAEKVRAMNGRVEYRDFFDFANLVVEYSLDLGEVMALFTQKKVEQKRSKAKVIHNWEEALAKKSYFLEQRVYTEEIDDDVIAGIVENLPMA